MPTGGSLWCHRVAIVKEARGDNHESNTAIRYYKQQILSLGKAADLAGITRIEFIDLLKFCGEPIFDFSAEELKEINQDTERLGKILDAPLNISLQMQRLLSA
ncbi:UPF0175 family protein [Desulfosarcina variabilis]|uniref:UPF0175 family protein n=1 Tax=Desulfosarcina variabilis TaxID=2300 RepID=UPI003AFB6915